MSVRRFLAVALLAIAVAACGAAAAGSDSSPGTTMVPATVAGVGVLPTEVPSGESSEPAATDAVTDDDEVTTVRPARTAATSTSTSTPPETTTTSTVPLPEVPKTVGEQVTGNRVLMIGDSILASTSRRYGNNMCRALVPLGWQVEVEAEVSREITFGNKVLRSRMPAGWDAAVILLGNNYGEKPNLYMAELDKMLVALAPRPVLLLTVTEFEPVQREVNDIIRTLGALYPNVTVVDWAAMSNFPGVLSADGLHLTDDGREFLAQQLAPYFGSAPEQPGSCLSSTFHDDSAGSVDGPKPGGNKPPTTARPTATTVKPTSATTKPPSNPGTTNASPPTSRPQTTSTPTTPSQTTPTQTFPAQTFPPQTSPPQTSPPQTSPPQTSPPQTAPPQTSPPQTSPPQTSPPATPPATSQG